MADLPDAHGYPMTASEYLMRGAVDYTIASDDAEKAWTAEETRIWAEVRYVFPALSCAICGHWAGMEMYRKGEDFAADLAEVNRTALCRYHQDRWAWSRVEISRVDFIAQQRASLNPPAESAA